MNTPFGYIKSFCIQKDNELSIIGQLRSHIDMDNYKGPCFGFQLFNKIIGIAIGCRIKD